MECSCGGSTAYSEHEVKTIETAKEWYPETQEKDLPIIVMKYSCGACGRIQKRKRKQL